VRFCTHWLVRRRPYSAGCSVLDVTPLAAGVASPVVAPPIYCQSAVLNQPAPGVADYRGVGHAPKNCDSWLRCVRSIELANRRLFSLGGNVRVVILCREVLQNQPPRYSLLKNQLG